MMKNENGRSMVEMLGVLAIIGVLSVAGIAGYTMAMNKYKANEIVNAASQLHMLAVAADSGNGAAIDQSSGEPLTKPIAGVELCSDKEGNVQYKGANSNIQSIISDNSPTSFSLTAVSSLNCS